MLNLIKSLTKSSKETPLTNIHITQERARQWSADFALDKVESIRGIVEEIPDELYRFEVYFKNADGGRRLFFDLKEDCSRFYQMLLEELKKKNIQFNMIKS